MTRADKPKLGFWNGSLSGPGVILFIPWVIVVLLGFVVYAFFMAVVVRIVCALRGRYAIFVNSNSPVWQDHIATNILPRLPSDAVILNWSDHLKWKSFSFPVRLFRHYGGDRGGRGVRP